VNIPPFPFDATEEQVSANIERYVDSFISSLQSFFLVMPKGSGFVPFERFRQAYQAPRRSTADFEDFRTETALSSVREDPLALVVLRAMLGFSPPEVAHIAGLSTGVEIDQSSSRRLDKRAREGRPLLSGTSPRTQLQVEALVRAAVNLISQGAPTVADVAVHRLDKIDTREGLDGVKGLAATGVPYEMLLYERFLGRPFATHRDAVSEKVGDLVEDALREKLDSAQIPYHKAGVAERFEDMDQAPDFLVPDQHAPSVVVEAKLAEDDGTARDKTTRIQHLAELRDRRLRDGKLTFDVIACVDGRGFGIRREDVKKLLLATKGRLFTLQTVGNIIDHTALKGFQSA
jgi:hypothetical protein